MLTEKECENALINICSSNSKVKDRKTFKQLIHEHFYNPPLKFEELEEEMVIWDNKTKMFIKIIEIATLEENCFTFEVFGWEVPIYDEQFEKNRFYRKEVKDDER